MKNSKFTNKLWIVFGICLFVYCIYGISKRMLTDFLVDENAYHTKAVIIDDKNFYPNQRGINPIFSYSYQFDVNGEKYTGNSHDATLVVGDTIEVEYYKVLPCFNKPLHPKE